MHGGGYCSDVELWSWALGVNIQSGDQRRTLDHRPSWCVGLAVKAAISQSRFQRHEGIPDVSGGFISFSSRTLSMVLSR